MTDYICLSAGLSRNSYHLIRESGRLSNSFSITLVDATFTCSLQSEYCFYGVAVPKRELTESLYIRQTWFLVFVLICLNGIDWVAFIVLDIGNPQIMALSPGVVSLVLIVVARKG